MILKYSLNIVRFTIMLWLRNKMDIPQDIFNMFSGQFEVQTVIMVAKNEYILKFLGR